jgi:hypothetical protein
VHGFPTEPWSLKVLWKCKELISHAKNSERFSYSLRVKPVRIPANFHSMVSLTEINSLKIFLTFLSWEKYIFLIKPVDYGISSLSIVTQVKKCKNSLVALLIYVLTILCCVVRYDFRMRTVFGSSLPPVVCMRGSYLVYVICV